MKKDMAKKKNLQVRDKDGFIYDVKSISGDTVTVLTDNSKFIDFNKSDVVFLN